MKRTVEKLLGGQYSLLREGEGATQGIFLLNDQNQHISFWNDVPIKELTSPSDIFTAIFEIPRYNLAQMQLIKEEINHPIRQDMKKNRQGQKVLRYYAQYPLFNYGFLPQTWESTFVLDSKGRQGDGDPIDIVDLSSKKIMKIGEICEVQVLGSLCLIDQGEVDWKILTIERSEAEESKIKNFQDLENARPGLEGALKYWFQQIKTFDGQKENIFDHDEQILGLDQTLQVIQENHEYFTNLKIEAKMSSLKAQYHLNQ